MKKRIFGAAIACACAALLAAPAAAADDAAIPRIIVTKDGTLYAVGNGFFGNAQNAFDGSPTDKGVAAAQARLARIPGSVDVVPGENYDDQYTLTLKDMLADTPGVFAEKRYGEEVRLSIRGSGIGRAFHLRGIQLLQDGVPISLADGSGDFQEIDPLIARYTEVYKGGNGLQYGASALGGAINIVTPTGHTAPDRNLLRMEGGSFGTLRTHGSVARVYDDFDLYAAATGVTSDGWRDQSAQENARFSGNLGYRLSDTAETRLYLTYNNINQEVPSALNLDDALHDPKSVAPINLTDDYSRDVRSLRLASKTSFVLGDGLNTDVGFYVQDKSLFHPIFQVLDQNYINYGTFARAAGRGEIAGHRNDFVFGGNARWGHTDAKQFNNDGGSRGAMTAANDQYSGSYDLYGENQFFVVPDVALVTGLQALYATREYNNNLNNAASEDEDYFALNPKLGMIWDVAPATQVFANVSRSYEVPTYSELVQPGITGYVPLDAQKAWTAEIGTRGISGRVAWDVSLYRSHVRDELLNFTVSPSVPAATFNADRTIHQGIEAGFDIDAGYGFVLRQTYAYNDFRFDDDAQYGGNRIAGVPQHVYRAELRYQHDDGWHVAPNVEWVPRGGYVDHANTLQAPGYSTVGFNAGLEVAPGAEIYLDARNLTDENYVSSYGTITDATVAGTSVFYPGEGRSVYVGTKISF